MTPRLAGSRRRKFRAKRRIRAKLSRWFPVFISKILQNVSVAFGWLRGVICRRPEFGTSVLNPPPILACPNRLRSPQDFAGEGQDRATQEAKPPSSGAGQPFVIWCGAVIILVFWIYFQFKIFCNFTQFIIQGTKYQFF